MRDCKENTKTSRKELIEQVSFDLFNQLLGEAQTTEQELRNMIKKENVHAVAWDKEIKAEYSKINSRVNRLHHSSDMFYTAFPVVHYPHFRADTKKKVRGGLAKAWKAPLDWLAHCSHWKQLAARMALYGNEMVGLSEACSTMGLCILLVAIICIIAQIRNASV
jgi:hypothetical protein